MSETNTTGSEIAVVGMACRFPGARTPEEFWRNLCRGVESIQPLSEEQLRRSGVSQADLDDPRYVRAAPLLADFDRFDASFFGYNALEARLMDPQQRLLLECSWEALERAGYDPATYGGAIGVFAGTKTNTYLFHLASRPEQLESMDFLQLVLGGDQAMLSTRISYKLDLKGPSYGLQTACSTSLVAVHLACQSLLIDECQMALAGGVAINVPHEVGYRFDEGGILSPDGHCRPFDAQAAGTVFGSGLGFVVLKRLEDALADGDHIHAVILGSATNNDGAHKASFTAPSVEGQTRVILEALACSGVDAESISYVEAHGTGTAVGDPMEILALSEAYSSTTDRRGFCAVGSVKSNVGHLDAAAGISSLIKTVLALEHGELPPTLHYDQPNPRIDFAASPFYVQSERTPWPERGGPRRAAVSSLGFGGTNAHLVLQQAPAANSAVAGAPRQEASWQLLTLSGRTPAALDAAGTGLADHLDAHPEVDLVDAAYTLKIGRQAFGHRRVVVCREGGDAARLLRGESVEGGLRYEAAAPEGSQRPIFLFPGQGSQYVGMGQDLYRREAVFRREVDRFCEVLRPELNCDLRELLYPDHFPGRADDVPAAERLTETRYAQPALFVVELALARLWMSWGVTPRAMLGHSLGEYVAACLAEVLTVDEALALVAIRGRLMQELPRGAMVAVAASEEELQAHLGDDLALAVINGPQRSVVAGPEAAINDFSQRMTDQGSKVRRLHTSHAFHSPMMEPILEPFAQRLREVRWQAPRIPYVSNLTGHWIRPEEAMDADYWVRHLRHTVRFADGLTVLFEEPGGALLEVGPGNTLSALARRHPSYGEASTIASMRHASDRRPDLATLLAAQGQLWLAGVPIDWEAVYGGETRRRVPLPTYPFDRRRHWIDLAEAPPRAVAAPTKNEAVEDWLYRSVWAPAEPPAEAPSSEARRWLLLIDEDGIGATLAENLEARGEEIVRVAAGDAAVALDDGSFRIDPASEDDYGWLLRRLSESARQPQNIVHLWSLSATAEDGPAIADDLKADFDRQQAPVFYSVLFLARALVRDSASMHLDIVTADVYPVRGTESLSPHRATVLGPCLVLSQEYPNVTCRQIDLTLEAAESIALAAQVTTELLADARSTAESGPQVAYRDGQRWTRRFESAALPAADQASRLRSRGVYLITGGLGLVGSTLATELASAAEARLALVGRTELPPRDDWRAFIEEHGGDHPVSRKISTVTALEQAGGEVLVLAADVTDLEAMRQAVTETRRHFGALHGVLHAAGEASGPAFQAIPRSGREECAAHFGPKVLGALVLERVLTEGAESDELDFVLLNSSLSAVLGGLGNVAYTAANAFLDTLAAARNSSGSTAWLSVDWDAWLDADGPGSDAAEAVDVGATLQELSIEPTQGGEVFRRLLAAPPEGPWIVSTGDLQQRLAQWVLRPLRQAASPSQRATDRSPLSAGELENQIVDIWRSVLDLETMGRDENFFDLGGNSLSGMQLVGEIERRLGVQVAPVALFEAPTVRALTHKLLGELGEAGGDETASSTEAGAQSPDRTSDDGEDLVGDEGDAIAVVGMACRFPGADSVEAYWRNLRDGVESITFFDDDQLSAVDPQLLDDPAYVKARPVLDDAECFDAALFGYSPREAERMDPQHRVFLELAWEALENAGHDPARHKEAIGVFAGAAISTYLFNLHAAGEVDPEDPLQTVVGNDKDSLTTSVSYKLDLKGPSIAVQSFCSTSLVAVHLAVRSLRAGECRMALAGGVSVAVPQATGYRFQEGGILSPDGHCRPFDAAANGTLFGNGAGIVALKRLRDAIADGDRVYALVRGTAINNDGSLKVGYTAPSVSGQADVVTKALADAGVSPETIGYVEAHGTGTDMGDPVEVAALTQAFNPTQGESREPGWCALGSVKGNVGHLDRAAGVASLIKAILTLDRQEIPPSLHFENPNPKIDFDRSPFFVNAELRPWQTNGRPRRAGVSALGFGGTNAHVVLEEAPGSAASEPSARGSELLVLSAASEGVLDQAADRLATFLEERPETPLGDVAFSLQVGRRELAHRQAWVCTDPADAVAKLRASRRPSKTEGSQRPVVFLFPGQGAQYLHMGAELYRCEPSFRRELDRCAEILEPHLEVDLRHLLYPEAPDDDAEMRLAQTRFAQPALFAVEYALARLWMEWGVEPEAMLGHSIGEYVAACLAGVFTLEDALALVAARGRLMQAQPGGSMLAVSLPEAETVELLDLAGLSLAAVNARDRCVVAGADALIEQLAAQLTERGVAHRGLHTSHAFHSSMLEPAVEPFCDAVHGIDRSQPGRRFISCVTGTWIEASQIEDPGYWGSQLRQTVRFADGIETLCQGSPAPILLEVGPGNGLSRLIGRHLAARRDDEGGVDLPPATTVASMRHPKEQTSDVAVVQQALGRLWLAGQTIDWEGVHGPGHPRRVSLPTYPFERQRFWIEADSADPTGLRAGRYPSQWLFTPSWRRTQSPKPVEVPSDQPDAWLVLSDGGELGDALSRSLAELQAVKGGQVTVALAGERFAARDSSTFTLRPDVDADFEALLEALADQRPNRILHLWGLRQARGGPVDARTVATSHRRDVESLLRLGRALHRQQDDDPTRLVVVTDGLFEVFGGEGGQPASAPVTAACRVLCEIGMDCRQVDVDSRSLAAGQRQRLVQQILDEMADETDELWTAYRGRHRWAPGLDRLEPAESPGEGATKLEGNWLVSGGLDGPGFDCTRSLAQVPGIRILLFEDDELPIRREWPSWLGDPSSPDRRELGESLAQQGHSAPFAARSNLVSEIAGKAEALAAEMPIASLPADFDETVDGLCSAYAYRCLADRFDLEGIGEISLDELGQRLEVDSRHAKLFAYLLRILAEDGLADSTQDGIRFNPLPDHLASPERMARDLAERFPAFRVGFDCLAHCAAHYPQILRGEVDPIAVLYPDGSGQMLADVMAAQAKYSTSQRYQRTIVEVLRGLAAETGSRPLRILELAGGEGGLTWELAEALQDLEVEYHFSDAGRSFVLAARREAARRGFDGMRFHGLEIAGDLAAQGFEQFGFDVVVGVDAVHTTARVSATLEWAGELLAPGGAMLLVEPTRNQRWVSLIWGLLDDWWRFSDSELRLHSPIVEPRALEEVLGQLSFAETAVLPTDATARSVADHSLLVLRQPMEPHTPEREAWAESLWRQQREQVGRRIRCVSELEELGAEVRWLVAKGQVSEMAEDIAQAATGPLRGVIHALPGATEESSAEAARRDLDPLAYRLSVETLRARLEGLGKALGQQAPPHALLVSGLAAAAGAVGAGPAAASDRFAERLAMNSSEAEGGLRWRSLVWGLADDRKTPLKMKAAALAHALTTFEPRLVLSRQPDSEMAIAWNRPRRRSAGDADLSLALTPSSGDGLVAPRDADERTVAEIWREVLGVERLDVRDPFFDLGGDSLIATQLHSRLRDAFGLDLPMAKLFEEPTIEGQARAVTEARNEQEGRQQEKLLGLLAQMSDEEAEAELARMLGEPAVVRDPQVEIETTS